MRVLVCAASRHGSTAGIADAVAATLREHGHLVDRAAPRDVRTLAPYGGVVLGSAVYAGHWLAEARGLTARLRSQLLERPVWLFSSGPVGDPPVPAGKQAQGDAVRERIGARGHEVFAGRIEPARLTLPERAVVRVLHAPGGDYRDWDHVRSWASTVAADLASLHPERTGVDG